MRAVVLWTLLLGACGLADARHDAGTTPSDRDANATLPPHATAMASDSGTPDTSIPFVDPLQCHLLCGSADAADCANAPDHQTCVDLCQRSIERCPALVVALLDCFGPVPTFVCDADDNLASTECGSELSVVQQCAAAGDAG